MEDDELEREHTQREMVRSRYGRQLQRQHRAAMLRESRRIEEALEADLQMLQDMERADAADRAQQTERRKEAQEDVKLVGLCPARLASRAFQSGCGVRV